MKTVAFIGLGNMGGPMACNLAKAGFNVRAFDLSAEALSKVAEAGAYAATDAADAVKEAEVVVSMLPAGKHVRALYMSEQGIAAQMQPGTLVIDSSTIDAESAKTVGGFLQEKGFGFIDAPVSGGVGGAQAGTLTFIVGGTQANFDAANSILQAMGKHLFHAGDIGAGQVAKICNNMLLSVLMIGTSEALQMGINNGLDPKVLSDIMLQSSGRNWTLEVYNPCPDILEGVPSSKGYQGGFMVDLMKKDLGLAQETAMQSQSATPMGALANSLYTMLSQQGSGTKDFSSIFEMLQAKQ